VEFIEEAACVAEGVAFGAASPERGGCGSAVVALLLLWSVLFVWVVYGGG
jgi:hypothetical protein